MTTTQETTRLDDSTRYPISGPKGFAPFASVVKFARANPAGAFFGLVCIFLILVALTGHLWAPHEPGEGDSPRLISPTWSYPFGTDNIFRDQFSRIIVGARNSIGVGFGAVFVSTVVGVTLGISAGYFRGWWEGIIMRYVDLMISFPAVVFLILILTVISPSLWTISLSIGLVFAPSTIRVVRSATLVASHQQYIEAARSIGCGPTRIMTKHVLPNVFAPILVVASIQIGGAILAEATISFLGLGVSTPSNPSWGRMLSESRLYWQSAWWLAVMPGIALSIAVLAFNIFGDSLRDALDPRLRGSR